MKYLEQSKTSKLRQVTNKLYGGLELGWIAIILLAVVSAVITAVFLQVPVFKETSFERMGVDLEAWIFIAIFIMPNCKSALDSALKTFVFFVISQPLIYLIQVPFSDMGWGLFSFYKNWVVLTLLTFPMAFVGWYIRKRSWLSLLIISPALVFQTVVGVGALIDTYYEPPRLIVTGIFCLGQVALFIFVFTENKWQRLAGTAAVLIAAVVAFVMQSKVDISGQATIPDGYSYSENAEISSDDPEIAEVSFADPVEGFVQVNGKKYGTVTFTVTDGDKQEHFTLRIYMENGHSQMEIKPQ